MYTSTNLFLETSLKKALRTEEECNRKAGSSAICSVVQVLWRIHWKSHGISAIRVVRGNSWFLPWLSLVSRKDGNFWVEQIVGAVAPERWHHFVMGVAWTVLWRVSSSLPGFLSRSAMLLMDEGVLKFLKLHREQSP